MRIVDGPDEVHRNQIGRMELEKYSRRRSRDETRLTTASMRSARSRRLLSTLQRASPSP